MGFYRPMEVGGSSLKMEIAFSILALSAALPSQLVAQATDCNDRYASPQANAVAQQQWENQSSPVYVDATDLARYLATRGLNVECIRRSKEEHLVEGQRGAAWFKTNQGTFEVWFFPDARAASGAVASVRARSSELFIQHQNTVFHVGSGDRALAANLQRVFLTP
jgi:hypothetical protein